MIQPVHIEPVNERKLIADFIRLAHCLMTTGQIIKSIEDGSYAEIMGQKKQDEFMESMNEKAIC